MVANTASPEESRKQSRGFKKRKKTYTKHTLVTGLVCLFMVAMVCCHAKLIITTFIVQNRFVALCRPGLALTNRLQTDFLQTVIPRT